MTQRSRGGRRPRTAAVVVLLAGLSLTAAACSRDTDPVGAPRRSTTTTTLPPDAFGPPDRQEEPPPPPTVSWVAQFGGTGNDAVAGVAGRDRTVLAVGATDGTVATPGATGTPPVPGGGTDVLTAAMAAEDGTISALRQQGGPGDDRARTVAAATDAETTLVCGDTTALLGEVAAGLADAWCAPLSADAVPGAVAQSGSDEVDTVAGVAVTADGSSGVAVGSTVGLFPGAQDPTGGLLGSGDALVSRVGPDGRPVWARQFGTVGNDAAAAAASVADGDTVVAGTTEGALESGGGGGLDGWVGRFDPSGNVRWITQFGTSDRDTAAGVAAGGDAARGTELFCAVGTTSATLGAASAGADDAAAAAFDATGDRLWTTQLGSPGPDRGAATVVDGGIVYVVGTAGGAIDGAERPELPSPTATGGGEDAFLAGLDAATGDVLWVLQFGTAGTDEATSITRTEEGLIVVGGTTTGQLGEAPASGGTDGFVVAFTPPAGGGGAASSA